MMTYEELKILAKFFDDCDDQDWQRLFSMLDDSGHGKFWQEKLKEVYQITSDHSE